MFAWKAILPLVLLLWGEAQAVDPCPPDILYEASLEAIDKSHALLEKRRLEAGVPLEHPVSLNDVEMDSRIESLLTEGANPNTVVPGRLDALDGGPLVSQTTALHLGALAGWESLADSLLRHGGGDPLTPSGASLRYGYDPGEDYEETAFDIAAFSLLAIHRLKDMDEMSAHPFFSENAQFRQARGLVVRLLEAIPKDKTIHSNIPGLIDDLVYNSVRHGDAGILEGLLERGARADTSFASGVFPDQPTRRFPLTLFAAENVLRTPRDENHLRILRLLVERGADPFVEMPMEGTLLHLAARFGDNRLVALLLGRDVNPRIVSGLGRTPKEEALHWRHADTADLLP